MSTTAFPLQRASKSTSPRMFSTRMGENVENIQLREHVIHKPRLLTYCPHSGQTNQLFALLTAMRLARELTVNFVIPPLVTTNTIGSTRENAQQYCAERCYARSFRRYADNIYSYTDMGVSTVPMGLVMNISRLQEAGGIDESSLARPLRPRTRNHAHAELNMCDTWRADLSIAPDVLCARPLSFTALREHHGANVLRMTRIHHSTPLDCLRQAIKRHTPSYDLPLNRRDTGDVTIKFATLYCVVDQECPPSIELPSHFVFNDQIMSDASKLVQALLQSTSTDAFACAHMRLGGVSTWDKTVQAQFAKSRAHVLHKLAVWLPVQVCNGLPVLLATESPELLHRESVIGGTNGCYANHSCFLINELLEKYNIASKRTIGYISAVTQQTCALATSLLLTRSSSFSQLIGALARRTSVASGCNHGCNISRGKTCQFV